MGMNLEQKFVQMRKAVPYLQKEKHSNAVQYTYAKLDDVWEKVVPVMNEIGVNCRIVNETAPALFSQVTKTRNGDRLMWVYSSLVTLEWVNADDPADKTQSVESAVAWNDDPAKAKGAAYTYAMKYDVFNRLSISMGEDDPDSRDYKGQSIVAPTAQPSPAKENPESEPEVDLSVTDSEWKELERIAERKGWNGPAAVETYCVKHGIVDRKDVTRDAFAVIQEAFKKLAANKKKSA